MMDNQLPPVHPGEILRELYMEPLELTSYMLAKRLNVPRTRIERIAAEKTGITPDTALRLAKFFVTSPQYWLNLQNAFDLKTAQAELQVEIDRIETMQAA